MQSMKLMLALAALLSVTVLITWGAGSPAVTYVSHDKVTAALAKGGSLVTASDLLVSGSHRDKAGTVEVHDKETDIFYVVDGSATFITGGKMIGGKQTKAGQWAGTSIEGGDTHNLSKGDVMIVPAGMPHWFQKVPGTISYYVVKSLKQ